MALLTPESPKAHEAENMPTVDHTSETLEILTEHLAAALSKFSEQQTQELDINGGSDLFRKLSAPYLPIYHSRKVIEDFLDNLENKEQHQFRLLVNYILDQYRDEYEAVDNLIEKDKITNQYLSYLIKPGDVLIEGKHQNARGFLCRSWLGKFPHVVSTAGSKRRVIQAWCWAFQGVFSREDHNLVLDIDVNDHSEKSINELTIRPLKYLDKDVANRLRLRGKTFWKCRKRYLVSYHDDMARSSHHSGDDRYMIDLKMYLELHKSELTNAAGKDDLEDGAMEKDEPPGETFLYLMPLTIKGYNLKKKKWLDLNVDQISEVVWNTEAFEGLVLDKKTKRLIQALVSNQLEAEKGTDLISGKGNGLVLLLHGGPGTGKTLTAESVAEIARKPLYPVTCGDIGTEPEDVENYLESVLHLGKTWGCVVLLDEADVFLEQRSLEDLRRNALVSVFLRVLEYYDGILILTSNRVGTFDEAFKSRIQLALHYANLSKFQRVKIWKNFIRRLEKLEEKGIDFDDLKMHIDDLAENKMNGREIRNVITTARLSAKWENETLDYEFLDGIIETAGRFNLYLEKLNNGFSQDQLAEDEGLRLAEAV